MRTTHIKSMKPIIVFLAVVISLLISASSFASYAPCNEPIEAESFKDVDDNGDEVIRFLITDPCKITTFPLQCTHDTCYTSWWDHLFGSGHKCNEICTRRAPLVTHNYRMSVIDNRYSISKKPISWRLNYNNKPFKKVGSKGWHRYQKSVTVNGGQNAGIKATLKVWARVKPNDKNKMDYVVELIDKRTNKIVKIPGSGRQYSSWTTLKRVK